jgi:hypothetical protein
VRDTDAAGGRYRRMTDADVAGMRDQFAAHGRSQVLDLRG